VTDWNTLPTPLFQAIMALLDAMGGREGLYDAVWENPRWHVTIHRQTDGERNAVVAEPVKCIAADSRQCATEYESLTGDADESRRDANNDAERLEFWKRYDAWKSMHT